MNSPPDEDEDEEYFPNYKNIFMKFMAGGVVSSIAVTIMAPLERAKLILQIQRMTTGDHKERRYKGVMDILKRIPKEQGFLAYWRGNTASVIRCFPYSALNFSLRDIFRAAFIKYIHPETLSSRILLNLLAGGLSGSMAVAAIYPLDYSRTRLALDDGRTKQTREYSGLLHCLKDTYKANGIRGIYRGIGISVIGVFAYRAAFFGIYDSGVDIIPSHQRNPWTHFILAETSALSGGVISYPIDTIRRTLMLDSGSNPRGRGHKSSWECAKHIYQAEGIPGFFRGNAVNLVRGTGGTIMLILYEYINVYLVGDKGHNFLKK